MVCGWLSSRAETALLAGQLRRRFDLRLPGGRHVYLCYHDPRVMPHLYALLDSAQRTQLLSLASDWLLLGRHGELIGLTNPQDAAQPFGVLGLTVAQAAHLLRIEPLNHALRQLARQGWAVPLGAETALDLAMVQAEQRGLTRNRDLASYAVLAWQWPADQAPMATDETLSAGVALARRGVPLEDFIAQHWAFGSQSGVLGRQTREQTP